jgi:hypothetical protein
VKTPESSEQPDLAAEASRPRADRRWLAIPLAFLAGAGLTAVLLAGGHSQATVTVERPDTAQAAAGPAASPTAQVAQLLALEVRERRAERAQRTRRHRTQQALRAAAKERRAGKRGAHRAQTASVKQSGGTEARASAPRAQPDGNQQATAGEQKTHAKHGGNQAHQHERQLIKEARARERSERKQSHAQAHQERQTKQAEREVAGGGKALRAGNR